MRWVASACPRAEQKWRSLQQEPGSAAAGGGEGGVLPCGTARAAKTPELHSSSDKVGGNYDICL